MLNSQTDLLQSNVKTLEVINLKSMLAPHQRGSVILLGNFDGIHLGHRSLIETGRKLASRRSALLSIMSCEPHPRQFFNPTGEPFRLSSGLAKRLNYSLHGFDLLFEPRFDAAFAGLSPMLFVQQILVAFLQVRGVVVGHDFRFAKDRAGTAHDLVEYGKEFGFEVNVIPPFLIEEARLSSSIIRQWLSNGFVGKVMEGFAGRWMTSFSLDENQLVHFDPWQCLPPEGAYQVEVLDDRGNFLSYEILELHGPRAGQLSGAARTPPGTRFVGRWSPTDIF